MPLVVHRVDGPSPSHPACVDIDFEIPLPGQAEKLAGFLEKFSKDRDLEVVRPSGLKGGVLLPRMV
jgi:hypothetical protein